MFSKSAAARLIRTTGALVGRLTMAAMLLFAVSGISSAASIKVVPSAAKATPGETFGADVVVEGIPSEGLGAIQFRLNVSAPGSAVTAVSDTEQGKSSEVSVSTPLIIGPATTSRSGIGDFLWNSKGSHGILVMENDVLQNGSGMYTLGHTNGASLPSGSGRVARFQINPGRDVAAEKIVISLSDVMLLDGDTVYPLESNTAATIDLKCYTQAPNVAGMSDQDATAALTAAKLSVGTIYEIDNTSGSHVLNVVLQQSQNAGTTVLCETPVDLAINTAPSEVGNISAFDKAGDESGIVVLSWTPSSSSDIAGYRIYNASGTRLTNIAAADATGAEISVLANGQSQQFRITAYDAYGNESAGLSIAAIAVDDVAPRIAVSGVSENAYYASNVQPVIVVQEPNLAIQEITLNGMAYSQSPITLEGNYLLKVLATDAAGNSSLKEINFVVDKTPPVISVAGIAKDKYFNTDLTPDISVTDANLDTIESSLNGSPYVNRTLITAESSYQMLIEAVDKAGNRSTDTYPFHIDKAKPVSTIASGTPKYEAGGTVYVGGTTVFTLSGTDNGPVVSGVEKFEYRANSATWSVYQLPVMLAGMNDGPLAMDYRAVDRATNIEDFQTISVTLDTTAPLTTLTLGQPQFIDAGGAAYVSQNTVFTLSASDVMSGVALTEYSLDTGTWTSSSPFTMAAEGIHTILYRSKDNLGNTETDGTFTAIVDNTAPVTTITPGNPQYVSADGILYATSGTTFTLSAADNLSGVAATEYRIDGGAWTTSAPFTVIGEGTHTIDYYSKDYVSNSETFKTLTLFVDNTPPVTTVMTGDQKYSATDGSLFVASGTTFTLSAIDNLSGVAVIEYRIDNGQWTAYAVPFTATNEGMHTIDYRSQDNVTNTETYRTLTVIVDNAAPVTTITTGDPKYIAADEKLYVTSASTFTLIAIDNLSGIAKTEYRIDNGQWIAYAAAFSVPSEGAHTIDYRSYDNVGNLEMFKTLTILVDNTPPVTAISTGDHKYTSVDGKLYVTSGSTFSLSATDNLSGVARTEYRIDGGQWTTYVAAFTVAAEGTHTIDYYSKDNVTNTENFKTLTVIVDNTAPVTTISTGDPKYTAADGKLYISSSTIFTLSATDNLSGIAFTAFRIDGGQWTNYAPFMIEGEGEHIIHYYSKDNVTNTESFKTIIAIVDNTPPVTTIATGEPKYTAVDGKLYVTSTSSFTLSTTDNLSGIAKTEYRIDNGQWTIYAAAFTVAGDGTHAIDYRSHDKVTNTETYKTVTVVVDNTAPVTSITTGDPRHTAADGKLYVTSTSIFTLAFTDNLSGVALTQYRINSGAWTAYAPFAIPAEGQHIIDYFSTDNVTNTEAFKSLIAIVDNTPPVTTIATGDPQYLSADGKLYVTTGSTFSLSASDDLSGVARTEYRIDNGTWTTYAPFTIAGEGRHVIDYRSRDNVMNLEVFKMLIVMVDNAPPVTRITTGDPKYAAADGTIYVTGSTAFTLFATDNLSGVASTEYRIDGGSWTAYTPFTIPAEGQHIIDYFSKDNVTNAETFNSLIVIVDNTLPVTTITTGDPKYTAVDGKLYVSGSTAFTLSATDNLSGVARKEYRIDSGNWIAYAPFTIAGEGQHIIDYRSQDNVMNMETFKTLTVIVDNTAPLSAMTTGAPRYESDGKLYVSGSTGITIIASDAGSGVKKTEYSIDGGEWDDYITAFTLTSYAEGSHTIRYRSIDNVNNPEDAKEFVVVLDKTPPQAVLSASDPLIEGVVNTVSPSTFFTLTSVDALSGVRSIAYRINNGPWQGYTGSFSLAGLNAGQYTIDYKATDNVLNEEIEKTITVRLITIQLEKKISNDSVVLVGFESDKSDSDRKQADIRILTSLLSSLNVTHTVTQNTDDLTAAMRSGRYNTYVLIDVKQPLIGQEIREAVNKGDGLIFIKTKPDADPFLDDVFGVKFSGRTTSDNLSVALQSSPISAEAYLQTAGKSIVSAITSSTAQVLGAVHDKKDVHPAIVSNQYQQGKTLLYAFDLLNSQDQALASALLVESLNYVRPQEHAPRALDSIPLKITVKNSREQVDVKLTEIIPSGTTADTVVPNPGTVADNTFTWQKSLISNQTAGFGYYLNLPDIAGDYLTKTELEYNNNGFFRPYGRYEFTITVSNSSGELLDKIIGELNGAPVESTKDANLITKAVGQLQSVNASAANRREAEDNIRYIVQALDEVRKVSIDVSALRSELDELLKIWEKKWYLMEQLAE